MEIIRVYLTDYKEQLNTFKLLLQERKMKVICEFIQRGNTIGRITNSEQTLIAKK